MNGLLANPLFHIGAGLLANAGPSPVPRGLGPGLLSGVQNYMAAEQAAQQQAMQRQLAEARMAQLAAQQEELARKRQQEAARQQAMQQYAATLPPEDAARLAQFAAMGGDVAGLLGEQMKPPTPTDDMREYEAAKAQGFQGTLLDFMTATRRAGATNVNVGDAAKPVPTSDLKYFRTPDGKPVPYGITPTELQLGLATGRFQQVGEAELKGEGVTATEEAQRARLARDLEEATEMYKRAQAAWQSSPGPQTKRDLDFAAERVRRAQAGLANPRGEPSGDVARSMPGAPGPFQSIIEGLLGGGGASQATPSPVGANPAPSLLPSGGPQDIPAITNDADYDRLPSGARFLGPDGLMRQKP